MASVAHSDDSRFDEAEADVDRGEPWRYREGDAPNPLTIRVTGWSTGHTQHGEADFLSGVDRDGKVWSVLVGSVVLQGSGSSRGSSRSGTSRRAATSSPRRSAACSSARSLAQAPRRRRDVGRQDLPEVRGEPQAGARRRQGAGR